MRTGNSSGVLAPGHQDLAGLPLRHQASATEAGYGDLVIEEAREDAMGEGDCNYPATEEAHQEQVC